MPVDALASVTWMTPAEHLYMVVSKYSGLRVLRADYRTLNLYLPYYRLGFGIRTYVVNTQSQGLNCRALTLGKKTSLGPSASRPDPGTAKGRDTRVI